jgi:O-antigen/teichoic acid export membrane protein
MKPSPDSSSLMRAVIRNTAWSTLAVIASPILQFLFGLLPDPLLEQQKM